MSEAFLDGKIELFSGDCLAALPTLAENSIDSCVTDPPYHLQSINKRFAAKGRDETSERYSAGCYGRHAAGFMGKQWDGGDIAFRPDVWREVYRVLKPGAHLLAFGGTRTYHRMACAIEDAGFEICDTIMWVYGSGFPKSHDVSKGIDREAGAKREVIGSKLGQPGYSLAASNGSNLYEGSFGGTGDPNKECAITVPATAAARQWEGWGTALKPACEPIVLARKPLSESTIAANVLRWGVGALNIDGCRVATDENLNGGTYSATGRVDEFFKGKTVGAGEFKQPPGRWPANLIHDGSEEVLAGFPSETRPGERPAHRSDVGYHGGAAGTLGERVVLDSGSAARFFYTAKADTDDRLGSKHPTVKPLDLMQYLVRLVTRKGGVTLDPFAGTGTTGEAAFREGMRAVLIEREPEYQADIERRMALVLAGPDERANAAIKQRMKDKPRDDGPLFGGADPATSSKVSERQLYGKFGHDTDPSLTSKIKHE